MWVSFEMSVVRGHKISACIVVRHLSPSQEDVIHGGTYSLNEEDGYRPIGTRPYHRLEVWLGLFVFVLDLVSSDCLFKVFCTCLVSA